MIGAPIRLRGRGDAPQYTCFAHRTQSLADLAIGRRVVKCTGRWGSDNELADKVFVIEARILSPYTGQVVCVYLCDEAGINVREYIVECTHFSGWLTLPDDRRCCDLTMLLEELSLRLELDGHPRQLFIAYCSEELAAHGAYTPIELKWLMEDEALWRDVRLSSCVAQVLSRLLAEPLYLSCEW